MTMLSKNDLVENNLQNFGEDIHWLRANQGLTIKQAAELIPCQEITLDELERGKNNLDLDLVVKISKLYNFKLYLGVNHDDY